MATSAMSPSLRPSSLGGVGRAADQGAGVNIRPSLSQEHIHPDQSASILASTKPNIMPQPITKMSAPHQSSPLLSPNNQSHWNNAMDRLQQDGYEKQIMIKNLCEGSVTSASAASTILMTGSTISSAFSNTSQKISEITNSSLQQGNDGFRNIIDRISR